MNAETAGHYRDLELIRHAPNWTIPEAYRYAIASHSDGQTWPKVVAYSLGGARVCAECGENASFGTTGLTVAQASHLAGIEYSDEYPTAITDDMEWLRWDENEQYIEKDVYTHYCDFGHTFEIE